MAGSFIDVPSTAAVMVAADSSVGGKSVTVTAIGGTVYFGDATVTTGSGTALAIGASATFTSSTWLISTAPGSVRVMLEDSALLSPALDFSTPAVGYEIFPRHLAASGLTFNSQTLRLGFFNCRRTISVSSVSVDTNTTAAAATPTLCRIGIYRWEADSSITLVGSTANDTTLFAAASTTYTKALSATTTLVGGTRYGVGVLVVTGAAAPTLSGIAIGAAVSQRAPKNTAQVNTQADLPSTVVAGSLAAGSGAAYAVFT